VAFFVSHHRMSTQYYTVNTAAESEIEIKKSRFIGIIMPCQSEQRALNQLRSVASLHSTANHLAFAWRIRQPEGMITERFHDAGEPSGTAGRPILAPLEGGDFINTVIAVIRYFGGVKLGTGGLTRAYGTAAKLAIEQATVVPWVEMRRLTLQIDYPTLQMLEYQLNKVNGVMLDQQFTDHVTVTVELPASEAKAFAEQFLAPKH
jgi:uncharacterized YigZ family protein